MSEEVFIGPFVGWRVLEYQGWAGKRVVSAYRNSHSWWPDRTARDAECRLSDSRRGFAHKSPHFYCTCGYYAYLTFEDALNCQQLFRTALSTNFEFVALVAGWGKVITHKSGFRSSRMEILAVHRGAYDYAEKLEEFARDYGVPYLSRNEMEDYARENGVILSEETLP